MKKTNDDKKKEPNDLDRFIGEVKALQFKCPQTVIGLPPGSKGLPAGCYNLSILLEFIIMNLEGKFPNCLEKVNIMPTEKIFNCKHHIGTFESCHSPFAPGTCQEPVGDCKIESESEDCTVDCPDYRENEGGQ